MPETAPEADPATLAEPAPEAAASRCGARPGCSPFGLVIALGRGRTVGGGSTVTVGRVGCSVLGVAGAAGVTGAGGVSLGACVSAGAGDTGAIGRSWHHDPADGQQ
jgi:hypothetical protein